jgi:tetratricopeptide (TPR) repeat protein
MCNFLEDAKIGGKLFNPYNWGGYVIYRLALAYKVFIHGETILYSTASPNILLDHVVIDQKLVGYERLLDQYDVAVLMSKGKIYFPGEEIQREDESYKRRVPPGDPSIAAQFSDSSEERAKALPSSHATVKDSVAASWTLLMVGREGSVYLNKNAADSSQIAACERFFESQGLSFSWDGGIDVAELVSERPDLAARYNVIPASVVRDRRTIVSNPTSDEAVRCRLDLADAYFKIGLIRDAAESFDELLQIRHYEYQALFSGAIAHHILGENDKAFDYLETVLAFSQSYPAVEFRDHFREHRPPPSRMPRKLPDIERLIQMWDGTGRL